MSLNFVPNIENCNKIKYYNYEIILLSSLVLIVSFITVKTILKTKEMHNA